MEETPKPRPQPKQKSAKAKGNQKAKGPEQNKAALSNMVSSGLLEAEQAPEPEETGKAKKKRGEKGGVQMGYVRIDPRLIG